ncbi:hypothetical protein FPV67DRAFT_1424346 [Lyophyllum atratum]|nr:hypothetical protein FPV67DRAFT_1424346 [Lyophyllum atratum]
MIALCRAKLWIVQSKDEKGANAQKGVKGHSIVYPQDPGAIARLLPPSIEDIVTPVIVLFIGSEPPTKEWLKNKAKPLVARADRVRAALVWLKIHNPLYKHIVINDGALAEIKRTPFLPFHVEHVLPTAAQETLQSRYDEDGSASNDSDVCGKEGDVEFQKVVIADMDGHASHSELRAAAIRQFKAGGRHIRIPHGPNRTNEYKNPALFPMMYPTLFPYGLGGMEDPARPVAVSLKSHVTHLFSLADRRFQEHHSFMFMAFNILQRRTLLLHTSLKVKRKDFPTIASKFAHVSLEAVHNVAARVELGDLVTARDDEERQVLELMKEVLWILLSIV